MIATRRLPEGGYAHGVNASCRPLPGRQSGHAVCPNLLSTVPPESAAGWPRPPLLRTSLPQRFARTTPPDSARRRLPGPLAPVATLEENLALARAANLLAGYGGEARHRAMAESAPRYLATPEVALARLSDPGILVAARKWQRPAPPHGRRRTRRPAAGALFRRGPLAGGANGSNGGTAAMALANPDVASSRTPARAAAYVCARRAMLAAAVQSGRPHCPSPPKPVAPLPDKELPMPKTLRPVGLRSWPLIGHLLRPRCRQRAPVRPTRARARPVLADLRGRPLDPRPCAARWC